MRIQVLPEEHHPYASRGVHQYLFRDSRLPELYKIFGNEPLLLGISPQKEDSENIKLSCASDSTSHIGPTSTEIDSNRSRAEWQFFQGDNVTCSVELPKGAYSASVILVGACDAEPERPQR